MTRWWDTVVRRPAAPVLMCVTWLFMRVALLWEYEYASFISVTWLIPEVPCMDTPRPLCSRVWHDSCMRVTWFFLWVRRDSVMRRCNWVVRSLYAHKCDMTRSWGWIFYEYECDSFIGVTWLTQVYSAVAEYPKWCISDASVMWLMHAAPCMDTP